MRLWQKASSYLWADPESETDHPVEGTHVPLKDTPPARKIGTYTVTADDTIASVALTCNTNMLEIMKMNNLSLNDVLQEGQKLRYYETDNTGRRISANISIKNNKQNNISDSSPLSRQQVPFVINNSYEDEEILAGRRRSSAVSVSSDQNQPVSEEDNIQETHATSSVEKDNKKEEEEEDNDEETLQNLPDDYEIIDFENEVESLNGDFELCENELEIDQRREEMERLQAEVLGSTRDPPCLLNPEQRGQVSAHLPYRLQGRPWHLVYSTMDHGISLKNLYRRTQDIQAPLLLIVQTHDGKLLGGFASECFSLHAKYFGTGETFVFTFEPEFAAYKWSKQNRYFQLAKEDSIGFGGGGGFALWLDDEFKYGSTSACSTFASPPLLPSKDFKVFAVEAWVFNEQDASLSATNQTSILNL